MFVIVDLQVQPRYLLPTVPCWALLGFSAWRTLLGSRRAAAGIITSASLAMTMVSSVLVVYPSTMAFSRSLRAALVPLAHEIRVRSDGNTCVATPDIGIIGYLSGARILDLGGLIEPRIQDLVRDIGYDSMLVSGRFQMYGPAEFVIDRSRVPERFKDRLMVDGRWIPLRTTQLDNLGISRPGPFFYTLYQLQGTKIPSRDSRTP